MSKLEIAIGEKAFSFTDWQDWLNNAQEMFYANELNRHNSICIDAAGRLCLKGAEFQGARQENFISGGRLQNMTEFTSGYLQEVTGDLDGPTCRVCGAIMVMRSRPLSLGPPWDYWLCLNCGMEVSCGTETRPS